MTEAEARERFASSRVARLASADATGRPHIVPIVFALAENTIYSAIDAKPKRSTRLRRLANVRENPRLSALADHYEEDWEKLWWVRADGRGRVLEGTAAEARSATELLGERYPQQRVIGEVLAIEVVRWSGWSALGHPG